MMMMLMIMIVIMAMMMMTPQPQPQLFQPPQHQETEMMIRIHMIHMKTEIYSMIASLGEEIWNISL